MDIIDFNELKFGIKPSPIDERDYAIGDKIVGGIIPKTANRPSVFELEDDLEADNQYDKQTCCAMGSSSGLSNLVFNTKGQLIKFSPGFIFGNRTDTDYQGEGMVVREALLQLVKCGDVPYANMPINDTYPNCKAYIQSHPELLGIAANYKLSAFARAYTEDDIKDALLAGHPVLCVIAIFDSFLNPKFTDGIAPDYVYTEKLWGLHLTKIKGYDDNKQAYKVRNSWGKDWQLNGDFYLKYNNNINSNEYWVMILDKEVPKPVIETYYRVQTEADREKKYAEITSDEIFFKHGIKNCLMLINGWWKVQCGSFIVEARAEAMKEKLIALGYTDAFITTIQK